MKKANKSLGAIMLIAGTAMGAATLALPLCLSQAGLLATLLLFGVTWVMMYWSGLILGEVALAQPVGTSFVTMAEGGLGRYGSTLAWLSYGVLLLTLLMAYYTGIATLVDFNNVFFDKPIFGSTLVALVVWLILYMGTSFIDALNRLMLYVLVIVMAWMLIILAFRMRLSSWIWLPLEFTNISYALPIVVTGFGFQVVVPSIRNYLDDQKKVFPHVVYWGSIIPLLLYLIWTIGLITGLDIQELSSMYHTNDHAINVLMHDVIHKWMMNTFIFAAIVSSLLGVSLSFADFIADAFKFKPNFWIAGFAAMIPWVLMQLFPAAFVEILRFGGFIVAILNVLLPCLMLLIQRKHYPQNKHIAPPNQVVYIVMLFAVVVMICEWL